MIMKAKRKKKQMDQLITDLTADQLRKLKEIFPVFQEAVGALDPKDRGQLLNSLLLMADEPRDDLFDKLIVVTEDLAEIRSKSASPFTI
jgi:hypothetical protein